MKRTAFTLVELLCAAAVLAVVTLAALSLAVRCHRELARSEDLVQFQGLAARLADEAARAEWRFVAEHAPRAGGLSMTWAAWQASVVPAPEGVRLDAHVVDVDADALLLVVEAQWMRADERGRAIRASTRVHRLLARADASLERAVPMEGAPAI